MKEGDAIGRGRQQIADRFRARLIVLPRPALVVGGKVGLARRADDHLEIRMFLQAGGDLRYQIDFLRLGRAGGPGGARELRRLDVDQFPRLADGAQQRPLGVAKAVLGNIELAAYFLAQARIVLNREIDRARREAQIAEKLIDATPHGRKMTAENRERMKAIMAQVASQRAAAQK